jgi:predicted metalloendopeptidase
LNQKRLKEMVDELGVKADASGTEKKLADYWASAMDEAAIEAAGMAPLVPLLDAVSAEKIGSDLTGLTEVLAKLILWGVGATPFSLYESPDK